MHISEREREREIEFHTTKRVKEFFFIRKPWIVGYIRNQLKLSINKGLTYLPMKLSL